MLLWSALLKFCGTSVSRGAVASGSHGLQAHLDALDFLQPLSERAGTYSEHVAAAPVITLLI